MTCPYNIKKFLWFKYEGDHVDSHHNVSEAGLGYWKYTARCKNCGRVRWYRDTHEEMIRMGIITPDGGIIGEKDN